MPADPGPGGPTVPATTRNEVTGRSPFEVTLVATLFGTEHPIGSVSDVVVLFVSCTVTGMVGSPVPTLHSMTHGCEPGTQPVPSTRGALKGAVFDIPVGGTKASVMAEMCIRDRPEGAPRWLGSTT